MLARSVFEIHHARKAVRAVATCQERPMELDGMATLGNGRVVERSGRASAAKTSFHVW